MSAPDLSFAIAGLRAFHLRDAATSYWNDAGGDGARYELRPGWRTVYARQLESAVLRVTLADGPIGWGEAVVPICPEAACLLAERLAAPLLLGRDFADPEALVSFLYDINRGRGYAAGYWQDAAAAIEIAIWDALGHRHGLPMAALLSPAPRRAVPVYLSGLRHPTQEGRIELARRWAGEGGAGVKLFLDGDVARGRAELDALRQGAPDVSAWMVDLLWSCPEPAHAAAARAAYGAAGVRWLECPMLPDDLAGHAALAATPGPPIALGEHFRLSLQAAPWIAARALDILQPEPGRAGPSGALAMAAAARQAGLEATPHMGSGFGLVQAATLHVAAALPDGLPCEYQDHLAGSTSARLAHGWTWRDGTLLLPDRPGIGITVDEMSLRPLLAS